MPSIGETAQKLKERIRELSQLEQSLSTIEVVEVEADAIRLVERLAGMVEEKVNA